MGLSVGFARSIARHWTPRLISRQVPHMVADSEIQRIARLTPLADVLASFDLSVGPVEPREEAVPAALGKTLAADAVIADGHPEAALALRDGYARARRRDHRRQLLCAGAAVARADRASTPARRCPPTPTRSRRSMPCRCAARGRRRSPPVAPGEGVLPPDADATRRAATAADRRAAAPHRCRAADRARHRARADPRAARARGARRRGRDHPRRRDADRERHRRRRRHRAVTGDATLEAALEDEGADAVVAIGGTGSGRNDASVRTLARVGKVAVPRHRHHAGRNHGARLRRRAAGAAAARPDRRGARRLAHGRPPHAGAAAPSA